MSKEFDQIQQPEAGIKDLTGRLVGSTVLWADQVTDELPFSVATINLLEGIQHEYPELEIRKEQLECLDVIYDTRQAGRKRALVQMATGLGKTTVVAADVKRFMRDKPQSRVLFLCHQNDILTQARKRFEEIIGPEHTYGNFTGDGEKDYHEVDCLFASFQVMREWHKAFLESEFDYVVVDESHHAKANTYEPTLQYFKPEFMLGVTATPDRHDLKNIREIFGEEVYALSVQEAIARGLVAKVDYRIITDEIEMSQNLRDQRGRKMNIQQLNRSIFVPKRDEEVTNIIESHAAEAIDSPKRIIFCESVEHTEELATYFSKAAPLHSKLKKWEQDRYIEQFRGGEIDTLLTVDMFNEGIDIPDANQIVFLRSTQSKTVFLQQLGRGLRKAPGKDEVQVLDFVANCDRLLLLHTIQQEISYYQQNEQNQTEVTRISVGSIQFSEAARDIIDILTGSEDSYRKSVIIQELSSLATSLERTPTFRDVDAKSKDGEITSPYIMLNVFGGWNKALEAAGLELNLIRNHEAVQDVAILEYLTDLSIRLGRTPSRDDMIKDEQNHFSIAQLKQHFSGFKAALVAAGLSEESSKANRRGIAYTSEELLGLFISKCEEAGKSLTYRDAYDEARNNKSFPAVSKFIKTFGSWNRLLEAAGMNLNLQKDVPPPEALVLALKEYIEANDGKAPSSRQALIAYRNGALPISPGTYTSYFGSWNNAVEATGHKPHFVRNLETDEIITQLRNYIDQKGYTPTTREYDDDSKKGVAKISRAVYVNRFGSWKKAVEASLT